MTVNETPDVAVFVGSLRKESFSRKTASALAAVAPASLRFEQIEIGRLSFYNQDDETDTPPAPWVALRQRILAADAFLFVTPEYNRSMPAVMKNALDIGSRPFTNNVWRDKPGAVASISTGGIGGFGANHHLRQCLVALGVPTMAQPELYIGHVATLFDTEGTLINDTTRTIFTTFMKKFGEWVEANRKG